MAKGRAMTDDELCTLIDHKIGQSVGAGKTADFVTADRLKALKYYKGEPLGDEVDGKSKVVSRDVAEAIDAMMPSIMKIFASGDEVVRFNATRPQDEAEAAQRTDYANWVWSTQNPGYLTFHTWFKDAFLEKLGTVKTWWEESTHETREEYEGLTDDEFEALLEDEDLELQEHTETPDQNQSSLPQSRQVGTPQLPPPGAAPAPAPAVSPNGPMPMQGGAAAPVPAIGGALQAIGRALGLIPQPKPPMLHDAVFRRMHDESRVRVAPVPPEETLINRQSGADELPWGNRRRVTIADLIEEFPKKEELIRSLPDEDYLHSAERSERFVEEGSGNRDGAAIDDETRMVWVVDAYFRVDFDGDGYAEFRKVTTAGHDPGSVGGILENCEYDSSPYACLTPIPMPHKLIGMSVADQTVDIQEIKTTLVRQGLNNVYLQHGSEVVVTGTGPVDYDALLNRRPGNVIRVGAGVTVAPLVVEPMLADIMTSVSYFDTVRDQRTGASRIAPGPGADSLNNAYTQTLGGTEKVESAGQERIEFYARTFAETGVKAVFQRIDELSCKHQTRASMLKLRGQWVEMNPADWKAKVDCTPAVGLGTGNKTAQVAQLQGLLTQIVAPIVQMQAGLNGPIVTAQSLHAIIEKLVQAMGFKNADQMFPDPTANPAPKAPPQPNPDMIKAQALVHTTQMKAQADGQKTAATLASQERIAQLNAAVERELGYAKIAVDNKAIDTEVELKKRQHETDTAFKAHGAQLDAREADREDRSADVQNAKAQHDAEHDTASLTQAGSLAREKQKSDASTSDRDFQAKNPNFSPPNPRKLIKVGLTHDAGGMVSAAKRHFDDGTIEDVPIARTQGNA